MRGATTVAPFSTRQKGGRVATPVAWDELATLNGSPWTLLDVEERAKSVADPWRDFFGVRQRVRA
jgi:DNA primase